MRTPHRKRFSAIPFPFACLHGQKNSIPDPGRSQEAWNDSNTRVWTYSARRACIGSVEAARDAGHQAANNPVSSNTPHMAVNVYGP